MKECQGDGSVIGSSSPSTSIDVSSGSACSWLAETRRAAPSSSHRGDVVVEHVQPRVIDLRRPTHPRTFSLKRSVECMVGGSVASDAHTHGCRLTKWWWRIERPHSKIGRAFLELDRTRQRRPCSNPLGSSVLHHHRNKPDLPDPPSIETSPEMVPPGSSAYVAKACSWS